MPIISYDSTEANVTAAHDELIALLTKDRVTLDLGPRISRSSTEWSAAPRGELDRFAIVVFPLTTEDVSGIAKICHRRRIPMTAFSGGTSLEGTLAATQGGVCVDFARMDKIIALRRDDLDVTVQPGVGHEELNEFAARESLFFPPDPGPGAKIGGMVSQGCSGTNAYRYGTMKDWVLGLTLVLADGTIVRTRGRPRKSNCGYDMTRLIVGSEGTLAFVTEAHLKLTSKPVNERVAVAAFSSMGAAVKAVVKIVQRDMPIQAMELLCDTSMRGVNAGGYCDKTYAEMPTLFFKFASRDKATVEEQIRQVHALAREESCQTFEYSKTEEEAESIWAARKTILWSMLALKNDPTDGFLSSDTAVPISKLAEAADMAKEKISGTGFVGFIAGHVGDGNFHTGILYPASKRKEARDLITWIQREAIKIGGTVTGEHGVGWEFRDMVDEELGESGVDMMRRLKLALDPLCLMNPDKVFRLNLERKEADRPAV
jgi:D-lactate dehydrogenase (cytochrome)